MTCAVPVKLGYPPSRPTAPSSREIELRLLAGENDLPRIIAMAGQCAAVVDGPETRRVRTIYYDTPDLRLASAGVALRLRQDGREWRLALKTAGVEPGTERAGLAVRREWERVLENGGGGCDFAMLDRIGAGVMVPEGLRDRLAPRFETVVERTRLLVAPADGVLIEVAVDRGQVVVGNTALPISDVELELKQGPVHSLFALAMVLHERIALRIGTENKADLGLRLLTGRGPVAAPPLPAGLTRWATTAEAFRHLMRGTLRHLLANVASVTATADADGVRQMRGGLRRLRLVLRLFAEGLPDDDRRSIVKASRWVSRCLGEVQAWDDLLDCLTDAPETELYRKAVGLRRDAGQAVSRSLRSRRFTHFVLMLGRWIEDDGWQRGSAAPVRAWLEAPVSDVVPGWLDTLRGRAERAAAHVRKQAESPPVRGRAQRRLRQLRDAVDLTRGLFPAGAAQPVSDAVGDWLAPLEQRCRLQRAGETLDYLVREVPALRPAAVALHRRWSGLAARLQAEAARRSKQYAGTLLPYWGG